MYCIYAFGEAHYHGQLLHVTHNNYFSADLVAPKKLIAKISSNQMLTVSWSYPSSLRDQITAFQVTIYTNL